MPHAGSVGHLLQYWRKTRHLTQLALALEAGVSPRHVCFLETGRARPSREMIMLLATVLDVPLRERNVLLLAAGFAPIYAETKLDAQALEPVRSAIDAILRQQEPFPAVVMNRSWDILRANEAAGRLFDLLLGPRASGEANVLRMIFDPKGLRPYVKNWEAVADAIIARVQREAIGGVKDPATAQVLDEVLSYPDVPARLHRPNLETPLVPVVPVIFEKDGSTFNFFSAITTLGTPQDITVQELRIESFFPADLATEERARRLSRAPRFDGEVGVPPPGPGSGAIADFSAKA
jgi:transcriptional regulator with XRE-family HTH domain